MNSVHKQPLVALNKLTKDSEITIRPPLLSRVEQRETALLEIDRKASNNQATSAPSFPYRIEP
jgi:hypothetical protein